ncbi:hypothetical protein I2485_08070 [Nesterenkonia sp. E16_7]|uniref:hypothetical protein n=1 Tax=unclassified Nesterenkonia TaxID=2629769 RepID=UPI001A910A92|nr:MULTISPECIES: hypothetical protein [unclassified Nesterenkonia]MBO0594953.1 hypothetical protein [Nesterenkonia sp. E16_10]MBO0598608.1 hypothetical protein [Nesterenkonia sp. E16_7]
MPISAVKVVADIDDVVRGVRLTGWQKTKSGDRQVLKEMCKAHCVKHKNGGKGIFTQAHGYIREEY